MDSDKPSPEERFHTNLVGLGELIFDLVTEVNAKGHNIINPEVVKLAVCLLYKLDHVTVINTFISGSNKLDKNGHPVPFEEHCWTKIKARDRSFFLDNAGVIFHELPCDRIDAFSRMFSITDADGNPVVAKEDENEIWEYFESLVKIAIKYIHFKRQPQLVRRGTEEIRRYKANNFLENVDLSQHAKHWDLTLEFPEY